MRMPSSHLGLPARILLEPHPLRKLVVRAIRQMKLGPYKFRYDIGAISRPNYAYLVYQAGKLAVRLGLSRVSIVEFGVAGGAGLVALEEHAEEIEKLLPVTFEIFGFDTGQGLPAPQDY